MQQTKQIKQKQTKQVTWGLGLTNHRRCFARCVFSYSSHIERFPKKDIPTNQQRCFARCVLSGGFLLSSLLWVRQIQVDLVSL